MNIHQVSLAFEVLPDHQGCRVPRQTDPNACKENSYTHSGITDFSPGKFPLAILFTAPDCSTGAFTSTYDDGLKLAEVIMAGQDADYSSVAWDGPLTKIKNLRFEIKG